MQASNEVRYLVDGIAVSSMHKVKLCRYRNYISFIKCFISLTVLQMVQYRMESIDYKLFRLCRVTMSFDIDNIIYKCHIADSYSVGEMLLNEMFVALSEILLHK